jgi:cyclic nucleotide gated channel
VAVTVIRTITDFFYVVHMVLRFQTAYVRPSTRVFGRGELVTNRKDIAIRYFKFDFWIDFVAVLPIPQVVIWIVVPHVSSLGSVNINTKNALRYIVVFQYIPRMLRIFPLLSKIISSTGVLLETAWAGAAFNLILYLLASHIVGATWYLLSVERQDTCWKDTCAQAANSTRVCSQEIFDCDWNSLTNAKPDWYPTFTADSNVFCNNMSPPNATATPDLVRFSYGIYSNAIEQAISSDTLKFFQTYFYCLWLGLLSLSSLAQTLEVSTFVGEIIFTIFIILIGLILLAFLIGNMQTYLQSLTVRLEEMRVKRRDTEQWMRHRNLPHDIVQRVRRYDQYKWVATRGVDEESLVQSLPSDLRRDIKRHLCLRLVRNVPFCDQMDDSLLDAMCERLRPALCTEGTHILREGDPVNEMFFVIRGELETVTTNGGRSGFYNKAMLASGDFCGEELLTWALDPKPQSHLPISTHSVKAVKEVEAFSLSSDDLKFVASQFRRLHSKQLQHTFRYYSNHWRTWGACFIQAAWRRYQRRRLAELRRKEEDQYLALQGEFADKAAPTLGATLLAGKFAKNAMRGVQRLRSMHAAELTRISNIPKPSEPDFSQEH